MPERRKGYGHPSAAEKLVPAEEPEQNGQEETVAVPEVHTGKVRHEAADSTPEADCPIHYDNVAIPEIHIHPRKK